MTMTLNENGIQVETYAEIFEALAAEYRSIYGEDIVIDADTPDGQRIGIEAKMYQDAQSFALFLYNALDPDVSSGNILDRILKWVGITRQAATQSQWDIDVTVSGATDLEEGYTIKDDLDQRWVIASGPQSLTIGTTTVSFLSETWGAVTGASDATLTQVTYNSLVTGLEPTGAAVIGTEIETDPETRNRFKRSTQNAQETTQAKLTAAILDINGVTDAYVYENNTNTTDTDLSLNANSIWAVIEGGDVADIAEILAKNKAMGCGMKGSSSETYTETVTRPDETTFNVNHVMYFDRPSETPLYVRVNALRKNIVVQVDTDLIGQYISEVVYHIAESASPSDLLDAGEQAGTDFMLYGLELSINGSDWVSTPILSGPGEKFTLDIANITVTEVVVLP